jgi:dienelactone hydrolase
MRVRNQALTLAVFLGAIGAITNSRLAAQQAEQQDLWAEARAAGMQDVMFPSGSLKLHGAIYRPSGPGPFPAVLYNHGSGPNANRDMPDLGKMFTARGYVLFIPHRRGHGRSADQGALITTVLAEERKTRGVDSWSRLLVKAHETEQLDDQVAAFTWLKQQPFVDARRMAIAGCSFGGIQTVLAAERNLGARAGVDFAGAAMTWADSPHMQARLKAAVRNATIPLYFLQAENDYDTSPSRELAAEAQRAKKPHLMRIFPPFGTTNEEGHGGFCRQAGAVWGDSVFGFLEAYMPR